MRACVICGVGIEHRHPRAFLCGDVCARKRQQQSVLRYRGRNKVAHLASRRVARRRKAPERLCAVCGGSMQGQHALSLTCSPVCKSDLMAERREEYADRRRELEMKRYAERSGSAEFKAYRSKLAAERRKRNRDDDLRRKRDDYYRNRDRYLASQKARRDADIDARRALARRRNSQRSAALKLIREIETKGLEALL